VPIEKLATVLPVDDLSTAVVIWTAALGVPPAFVDEPRWAQFDIGSTRLALAGSDRISDCAAVMGRVTDLLAERARMEKEGLLPGPIETGPHELRMTVVMPSGAALVLYEPL
jgi:hypothetical protein